MGGRNRGAAARAYGACTHPHPWANEQGLRVLLGNAALAAAQRGLHVTPVFSLFSAHGPVFRCLVRVHRGSGGGPAAGVGGVGFAAHCPRCGGGFAVAWGALRSSSARASTQLSFVSLHSSPVCFDAAASADPLRSTPADRLGAARCACGNSVGVSRSDAFAIAAASPADECDSSDSGCDADDDASSGDDASHRGRRAALPPPPPHAGSGSGGEDFVLPAAAAAAAALRAEFPLRHAGSGSGGESDEGGAEAEGPQARRRRRKLAMAEERRRRRAGGAGGTKGDNEQGPGPLTLAGPLWTGPLHSPADLAEMARGDGTV